MATPQTGAEIGKILSYSALAGLTIWSTRGIEEAGPFGLVLLAWLICFGCIIVLGWAGVAPAVEGILDGVGRKNFGSFLLKVGVVTIGCATASFILFPRDAIWFGDVGDFFGPVLSLLALAVLAAALGLQREDLESTRRSLYFVERQLETVERARRYQDTSTILMKGFDLVSRGIKGELEAGGGGPCLNVELDVLLDVSPEEIRERTREHFGRVLFRKSYGVVLQGHEIHVMFAPVGADAFEKAKGAERLWLRVGWENIHRTRFGYSAEYVRGQGGRWEAPESILFEEPEPLEIGEGLGKCAGDLREEERSMRGEGRDVPSI
jgi:hypothetical protein